MPIEKKSTVNDIFEQDEDHSSPSQIVAEEVGIDDKQYSEMITSISNNNVCLTEKYFI